MTAKDTAGPLTDAQVSRYLAECRRSLSMNGSDFHRALETIDRDRAILARIAALCREHKWSVMVDESGRMEDAILVVDVERTGLAVESKEEK